VPPCRLCAGCRWVTRVASSAQNIPFSAFLLVLLPVAPAVQMGQSGTADAAEAFRELRDGFAAARRAGPGGGRDLPEGVIIGEHVAVPGPP
jgi:hypothetical protein